ncbi:MAG: DUF4390 domain-containing protein [Bdellovibrionales bacterium]|nr:DUF4390 domain-containing protein [Ramlibacter sp.]
MASRTIQKVITTVSFTRCWKKVRPELAALLAAVCVVLAGALGVQPAARADGLPEITKLKVERAEEGVYLSAEVKFDLPPTVEDALVKGIPMYFVAEAELFRDRWYWYDRKVVMAARHMRLAFQPLTRRWRLNVSPTPITNAGLGVTLNQSYESLSDAMGAVQRISRWKIAEAGEMDPDARHNIDFRFRLDVSQLPRPLQIGAVGQAEWDISVAKNQRLIWETSK